MPTLAPATPTVTTMTDAAMLPLMIWLSPAFPVGSFAYSHGLEWAIEAGDITDRASVEAWLRDLLAHGATRNDAILLALAWRAVAASDDAALREANDLALALAGSRERHLESTAQGNAFMTSVAAAWPAPAIEHSRAVLSGDVAYPIALGVAAAAHNIALPDTAAAYLTAAVGNLVSAVVRLNVIGQTDGQRVIATLCPVVRALATSAAHWTADDLGGAAFRSDIAAIRHETQHTRLFRS